HDDDDQQDQADPAAGIVAPTAAVGPRRQGAEQKQDQYDEQDRSEHGCVSVCGAAWRVGWTPTSGNCSSKNPGPPPQFPRGAGVANPHAVVTRNSCLRPVFLPCSTARTRTQ